MSRRHGALRLPGMRAQLQQQQRRGAQRRRQRAFLRSARRWLWWLKPVSHGWWRSRSR
jgi:hypothetical protein